MKDGYVEEFMGLSIELEGGDASDHDTETQSERERTIAYFENTEETVRGDNNYGRKRNCCCSSMER